MLNVYFPNRDKARDFSRGVDNRAVRRSDSGEPSRWYVAVDEADATELYTLLDSDPVKGLNWEYVGDEMPQNPFMEAEKDDEPKTETGMAMARTWWSKNLESFIDQRPRQVQDRMNSELGIQRNTCRGVFYKLKIEMPIPSSGS